MIVAGKPVTAIRNLDYVAVAAQFFYEKRTGVNRGKGGIKYRPRIPSEL
jgi:hypothetical protein